MWLAMEERITDADQSSGSDLGLCRNSQGGNRDSDSEECDDPGDTLIVPEAESIVLEKSPSPREEIDSGMNLL